MIPNRVAFYIAFPSMPQPVVDVWDTIITVLKASQCLPKKILLSQIAGHPDKKKSEKELSLTPNEARKIIIDRDLNGFRFDSSWSSKGIGFWLHTYIASGPQAFLQPSIQSKTKAPPVWNQLIEGLLVQWSSIGAWQWNHLYHIWQTYCVSESYDRYFGDIPPGTKRYIKPSDDGISPDREMIDISLNPGRKRNLLPAIDFHATAEMWLGPDFWQYAKCTKEDVLAADFFLETRDTPHFLYLKSWPEPFTRPDGEQGRVQQKLWQLFFHEECEWPPGSGGISDEPVGGPPELMPGNFPIS